MTRPRGRRNADFDASRAALLDTLVGIVMKAPDRSSVAELADSAGVSRATVRHYFGSRDELLSALLTHIADGGKRAALANPEPPGLSLRASLLRFVETLVEIWPRGVGALYVAGLFWGLEHPTLGPAYVDRMLEPLLARVEQRVASHSKRLAKEEARYAALALLSPVLVALLHQGPLGGAQCRPLDMNAFLRAHVDKFMAAWFPDP
jgi:AcrR family transcriptional regulator